MDHPLRLPDITAGSLFTRWQFDPVIAALAIVVAGAYLLAVWTLRRRGASWPYGRTALFVLAGVGSLCAFTMSGLAVYDRVLFWAAAVQYSLLLGVSPILLSLGDPLRLALEALPDSASVRLRRVIRGPVVQTLAFPLVASSLAVATQLTLYLTPYFLASVQHPWIREALYAQLLVAGCLFTLPLHSDDVLPDWCSYPLRTTFAGIDSMLDAIPGIVVLTSPTVIGRGYYLGLHLAWLGTVANLHTDQQIGGGMALTIGEAMGLPFAAMMFVGWMRSDRASAAQADRELDRRDDLRLPAPSPPGTPAPSARPERTGPELMRPWWEVEPGLLASYPGWRARPGRPDDPDDPDVRPRRG